MLIEKSVKNYGTMLKKQQVECLSKEFEMYLLFKQTAESSQLLKKSGDEVWQRAKSLTRAN